MTDRQKWGTTENFHLPYPAPGAPIHEGAATIQALAEAIDHSLTDLLARIERLEKKVKDLEKRAKDTETKELTNRIKAVFQKEEDNTTGNPVAITLKVTKDGDLSITAPGYEEEQALDILTDSLFKHRRELSVKRRLQGD
ncbi:hypothetical protein [Corynebacterium mastitidis]|uniref:hypothetical protein n=1 Tax=Corynebacterium mastitidis TaxID=161890 RepID=UPI000361BB81|nr:hypothetical protein [Corynebacterium mastitidis]